MKTFLSRMLFFSMIALLSVALVNHDAMAKKKKKGKNDPPEWVNKPGLYEDVIVAAGTGEALTEQNALTKAETDGRKQIAQVLGTELKNMTTAFSEEANTTTEQGSTGAAQDYMQSITQSITKQTLVGVQKEENWPMLPLEKNKDGKYKVYVKMILKKSAVVDAYKKDMQKAIAEDKIKGVKMGADDALKALDKAIGSWEKKSNNGSLEEATEGGGDEKKDDTKKE
jgi:hypothetical protein